MIEILTESAIPDGPLPEGCEGLYSAEMAQQKEDVADIRRGVLEIKKDLDGIKDDVKDFKKDVKGLQDDVKHLQEDTRDINTNLGWYWKAAALMGGGILFLFGWVFIRLPEQQKVSLIDGKQIGRLSETVAELKVGIEKANPDFSKHLPSLLESSAAQQDAVGMHSVSLLARNAQYGDISIPFDVVRHADKLTIDAWRSQDPMLKSASWNANISLLNYTSSVRGAPVETSGAVPQLGPPPIDWGFRESGDGPYWVAILGQATANEAARGEHIGDPASGHPRDGDPAWFIVDSRENIDASGNPKNTLRLDDHFLKKIVYMGLRIAYRGGPLKLENVYFIRCTFDVVQNDKGARFSESVSGSPATTATF